MTRLDGAESIGLLVRKESGANTVKVTKLVREIDRPDPRRESRHHPERRQRAGQDDRGRHRRGQGRAHPGRDPGLPDPAHLPSGVEDAAHHRDGHPHLGHRRVQPALLRQHHPQHHVARRPGPGGGHARRLRRRRLGEHLPPPLAREGPQGGGLHRDEGGRAGGRVHGPDDHRRLPARHLRPRRRRAAVQGHGPDRHLRPAGLAPRLADPDRHARVARVRLRHREGRALALDMGAQEAPRSRTAALRRVQGRRLRPELPGQLLRPALRLRRPLSWPCRSGRSSKPSSRPSTPSTAGSSTATSASSAGASTTRAGSWPGRSSSSRVTFAAGRPHPPRAHAARWRRPPSSST